MELNVLPNVETVNTEEYNDTWRFLINLEQRKLDLKKQR